MPCSAGFAVAILACFAAGRCYVALDVYYPARQNAEIIADAGVAALIIDSRFGTGGVAIPIGLHQLDLSSLKKDFVAEITGSLPAVSVNAPAVILYTSGSTGRPKGIVNSQKNLLQRVIQYVNSCHIDNDDVLLLLSSFCTIAGTREALTSLLVGSHLCIVDPKRNGVEAIRRAIRERAVSIAYSVPALIRSVFEIDDEIQDFRSLRVLRLGGDRVLRSDIVLVRRSVPRTCYVQIAYSSTETTGTQWFVPFDDERGTAFVPIGYALPGITFAIVDETGGFRSSW
jgi:non-ribosomal peptide synthetase component F